jgi:hypothetical protein
MGWHSVCIDKSAAGESEVRLHSGSLTMSLLALAWGCAEVGPSDGGTGGSEPPSLSVACTNNVEPTIGILDWQLTVTPSSPVQSGRPFDVIFGGVGVFDEGLLDTGMGVLPHGVREINLVDFKATVHVRSGATGDDVVLGPEAIPYKCKSGSRTACDPANDVIDDPPRPRGLRGNTDCEPVAPINPCGRFIFAPTSTDCATGGECASLGKSNQCVLHGFCITGDLDVPLQETSAQFTAGSELEALFGWDDESTGATIQEGGGNDGTWILLPAVYNDPTGPIGLRLTVEGILVAFECTMGVDSQGPLGVDSLDALSSRTPNSELIAIPIGAGGS